MLRPLFFYTRTLSQEVRMEGTVPVAREEEPVESLWSRLLMGQQELILRRNPSRTTSSLSNSRSAQCYMFRIAC